MLVLVIFLVKLPGDVKQKSVGKRNFAKKSSVKPVLPIKKLELVEFGIDRRCKAYLLIRNNGPNELTDQDYDGIFFSFGNRMGWRFNSVLKNLDPQRKLEKPGGELYVFRDQLMLFHHFPYLIKAQYSNKSGLVKGRLQKYLDPCRYLSYPDLTIKNIRLIQGNDAEITIQNNGAVGVHELIYYATDSKIRANPTVRILNSNNVLKEMSLKDFDTEGKLKVSGGSVKRIFPLSSLGLQTLPGTTYLIGVVVNKNKCMAEGNYTNNTLAKTLTITN